MLVESSGFDVVAVHTGGEALARLRADLACCLIVLDWWLADMTGAEFLRQLRASPEIADVPVALSTGDARVRAEPAALGVTYFLLKPVEPDTLVGLLTDHCPQQSTSPGSCNVA